MAWRSRTAASRQRPATAGEPLHRRGALHVERPWRYLQHPPAESARNNMHLVMVDTWSGSSPYKAKQQLRRQVGLQHLVTSEFGSGSTEFWARSTSVGCIRLWFRPIMGRHRPSQGSSSFVGVGQMWVDFDHICARFDQIC